MPVQVTTPGKRGFTGKHGNHWRPPVKPRVTLTCEVCGRRRELLPSRAAQRSGRFCSQACKGKSTDTRVPVPCSECGTVVLRRPRVMAQNKRVYCSRQCLSSSRRTADARWRNPEAIREYMRAYVEAHRDQHNQRSRTWAKANRMKKIAATQRWRARLKTATVEPVDYARIILRDRMRCHICKRRVARAELHFDHVIPLSKGGEHSESNIAVAHGRCNVRKSASLMTLF